MGEVYYRDEVAKMLRVSIQTIDKEICRGKLKRLKIGSRVLIQEEDLKEYIENSKALRKTRVGGDL